MKKGPLSEREGDIPLLARHFLEEYAAKNRKNVKGFTPQAMDLLLKYSWPGNVRELENAVERGVILAAGEYVTPKELPLNLLQEPEKSANGPSGELAGRNLEDIEKEAIARRLRQTEGNRSETARILGITRATLHKKLKKYAIG